VDLLFSSIGAKGIRPMAINDMKILRNQQGQAVTEYILLLSIVVGFYLIISQSMARFGLTKKLVKPIQVNFAATYRYGHPKARGSDEGSPRYHPRYYGGENNFRIFASPEAK